MNNILLPQMTFSFRVIQKKCVVSEKHLKDVAQEEVLERGSGTASPH